MLKTLLKHVNRLRQPRTLASLEAYAQWAARYPPHAHNPLMQIEETAMVSLMPELRGRAVLDLACGTGRYGLLARRHGARAVISLDNSAAMLRANPLPNRALASIEALPLPAASLDVILCGLALGHLPQPAPSLREISRVLRPDGCALISDFHPILSLSGRQRTFTGADGRTHTVEHYTHLYGDYHAAAHEAGLRIEAVAEPRLGDAIASGADLPSEMPVVIVYRLRS